MNNNVAISLLELEKKGIITRTDYSKILKKPTNKNIINIISSKYNDLTIEQVNQYIINLFDSWTTDEKIFSLKEILVLRALLRKGFVLTYKQISDITKIYYMLGNVMNGLELDEKIVSKIIIFGNEKLYFINKEQFLKKLKKNGKERKK